MPAFLPHKFLPPGLSSPLVWRCAALGLAAAVLALSLLTDRPDMDVAPPDRLDAVAPSPVGTAAGLREPARDDARGSDIISRPVFDASRRPWVAPRSSPSPTTAAQSGPLIAPAAPPTQWTLTGTMLQDGPPVAILRSASTADALVLHEGDRVEGWTLQTIRHDRLTFERDGRTWDLGFRKAP